MIKRMRKDALAVGGARFMVVSGAKVFKLMRHSRTLNAPPMGDGMQTACYGWVGSEGLHGGVY